MARETGPKRVAIYQAKLDEFGNEKFDFAITDIELGDKGLFYREDNTESIYLFL